MNPTLHDLMRAATRLTRAGRLNEASAAIQRALGGSAGRAPAWPARPLPGEWPAAPSATVAVEPSGAIDGHRGAGAFLAGSHTHATLTRGYKLCVPAGADGRSLPLVVMLHGCTQDPDDFAAGTGMNALATEQGFYVLYPAQAHDANPSRCWNWFKHNHQQRGRGEPAVIASMTQAIMQAHDIDPRRVYVAGLSAGGAMAAIVGAAYPDVYAAVGVHSGLAPGAASNLPEALAAMKGGASGAAPLAGAATRWGATAPHPPPGLPLPVIVFHGDRDATVHPRNGEQVVAAALGADAGAAGRSVEQGVSARGRRYTRAVSAAAAGRPAAEHWVLHDAGHAWSGGRAAGSYTDPQGPDASREMLRFFLEHARHGMA